MANKQETIMDKITELSFQLLQTTQALHQRVQSGEWEASSELQHKRTMLVAELDAVSRQPWPEDVAAKSRALVEQARALEKEVIVGLTERRNAIGLEYSQLQQNQRARKAYSDFS